MMKVELKAHDCALMGVRLAKASKAKTIEEAVGEYYSAKNEKDVSIQLSLRGIPPGLAVPVLQLAAPAYFAQMALQLAAAANQTTCSERHPEPPHVLCTQSAHHNGDHVATDLAGVVAVWAR